MSRLRKLFTSCEGRPIGEKTVWKRTSCRYPCGRSLFWKRIQWGTLAGKEPVQTETKKGEGACSRSWEKDQHINFWVEDGMERLLV